jgi:hypothetical protein
MPLIIDMLIKEGLSVIPLKGGQYKIGKFKQISVIRLKSDITVSYQVLVSDMNYQTEDSFSITYAILHSATTRTEALTYAHNFYKNEIKILKEMLK